METTTPPPDSAPQAPKKAVFHAYVTPPPKRHWGRWIAAVVVLAIAAYALAARRDPKAYTVITRHGIKQVRLEMTTNQVVSVLGRPLATSNDGCYRYGMPVMDKDFDVYKVCFADGRVSAVKTERFEAREIPTADTTVEELPGE